MMQLFTSIQTAKPVTAFAQEQNFSLGARGVLEIRREGDTVFVRRKPTTANEEFTLALPWSSIVAGRLKVEAERQPFEEESQTPPAGAQEAPKKRRGRPRKNPA